MTWGSLYTRTVSIECFDRDLVTHMRQGSDALLQAIRRERGLPHSQPDRQKLNLSPSELHRAILTAYGRGLSSRAVAAELGCSSSRVRGVIARHGVSRPGGRPRS